MKDLLKRFLTPTIMKNLFIGIAVGACIGVTVFVVYLFFKQTVRIDKLEIFAGQVTNLIQASAPAAK